MNILVVGGAGYIGSAVAVVLRNAGHTVVAYDDLSHGHRRALPDGVPLVVGDVGDAAALDGAFRQHRFDAVLHFAAMIEAGESMRIPDRYFRTNVAGTMTLLETMLRHDVKRFVFASTAAIYGDTSDKPVREDMPLRPTNPYGESKRIVEQMLDWIGRAHGLRYAALRYFNIAGALDADRGEDHRPESHLIPLVLSVASGKRPHIALYGTDHPTPDGTCVRDYIHVADLADAHLRVLDAFETRARMVYNLGTGTGFSVRQVIAAARRVTGHPIPVAEQARRPGDPAVLVASADLIRTDLGWQPQHDLDAIIASAWDWHRKHPEGYGG
jgi:UDP-glucose 4-epimerase